MGRRLTVCRARTHTGPPWASLRRRWRSVVVGGGCRRRQRSHWGFQPGRRSAGRRRVSSQTAGGADAGSTDRSCMLCLGQNAYARAAAAASRQTGQEETCVAQTPQAGSFYDRYQKAGMHNSRRPTKPGLPTPEFRVVPGPWTPADHARQVPDIDNTRPSCLMKRLRPAAHAAYESAFPCSISIYSRINTKKAMRTNVVPRIPPAQFIEPFVGLALDCVNVLA